MAFAVEVIPDSDSLYRRIHRSHLTPEGKISSAAFKDEQMSVNWEKYCDAKSCANESSVAVAALIAAECRALSQTVLHAPVEPDQPSGPNQAHAEVRGRKTGAISAKLRDKANTAWQRQ